MALQTVDTRSLVRGGLLTALVAAATLVVRIPTPATQGYVNIGDAVIVAGALLYGGRLGGLAGGMGSALADLLGGYFVYAPFTLVIKGIEGGFVGGAARWLRADLSRVSGLAVALGLAVLGTSWMVVGYFLAERQLFSVGTALANVPSNAFQAAASILIGLPLAAALRRTQTR
jgi:uncharacterized membrane protein